MDCAPDRRGPAVSRLLIVGVVLAPMAALLLSAAHVIHFQARIAR
jgi:hypothetical protein